MKSNILSPSILAADFANLQRDIELVTSCGAQWIHVDVMDGHFVPNISIGIPVLKSVRKITRHYCDVHLMISNPELYIDDFAKAGADMITIHSEATNHIHRAIQQIKENGKQAGLALNPHTPLSALDEIIEDLDLILIMTVNPGFGGQSFIQNSFRKLERLSNRLVQLDLYDRIHVEVDGGIKLDNLESVKNAGANVFVSGSGIFNSEKPCETTKEMLSILDKKGRPI